MAVVSVSELKKSIAAASFCSVYLFCGEEKYLARLYLERILAAVPDGGLPDFNRLIIEDAKTPLADISDFAETYPMMSDKKILVMRDTGILKSASEEVKKFWTELIANIPDYLIIVFAEAEADKRGAVYKAIGKAGKITEFEHLSPNDAVTWIERQALSAKKKITKDNAQYLVEICTEGLEALKNETDKLFSFCGEEITRSDIDRLVSKSLNTRIFEMTDAVTEHNADKALKILADMKTVKESAYNILFTLFSTLEKMLYARLLAEEGESAAVIAQKLKVPPFVARKYMKKSFGEDFLVENVCEAARLDLAIKNGETDDWTALEQYVLKMLKRNG